MRHTLPLVLLLLLGCTGTRADDADRSDGKKPLKKIEIKHMLRTYCWAGSTIRDSEALGGFGPSKNVPRSLGKAHARLKLPQGKLTLLARPDRRKTLWKKYEGFELMLVNRTGKRVAITAQDSALDIVCEAQDAGGKWRAVEYMPGTFCGNSYHRVLCDDGQYWSFVVPRYHGRLKTRLRFRLRVHRKATPIYSNVFEGSVHPEQFTVKRPYERQGLMDPRTD